MSLHYHSSKANMVINALSRLSIGSLAHVKKENQELVKDIHHLANLGVRFLDSKNGSVMPQNRPYLSLYHSINKSS